MRLFKGYIDVIKYHNIIFWQDQYFLYAESVFFYLTQNNNFPIVTEPLLNDTLKLLNQLIYDDDKFIINPYDKTINNKPITSKYIINNQQVNPPKPKSSTKQIFTFDDTVTILNFNREVIVQNKHFTCSNANLHGGCLSWKKHQKYYYTRGKEIYQIELTGFNFTGIISLI